MPKRQIFNLSAGKKGTAKTISYMIKEIRKGATDWFVIQCARKIVLANKVNPRNERQIADAIFHWGKEKIEFVRDPSIAESIQSAKLTIITKSGDCDDQSIALCALNIAVGNTCRLVTIGPKDYYTHVYYQVKDQNDNWISYDPVVPISSPGWEAKNYKSKTIWNMNGTKQTLSDYVYIDAPVKDMEYFFANHHDSIRMAERAYPGRKYGFPEIEYNRENVEEKAVAESLLNFVTSGNLSGCI